MKLTAYPDDDITLIRGHYHNGRPAILLRTADGVPICTLSVNIPEADLDEDEILINHDLLLTDEGRSIIADLQAEGVITHTLRRFFGGFGGKVCFPIVGIVEKPKPKKARSPDQRVFHPERVEPVTLDLQASKGREGESDHFHILSVDEVCALLAVSPVTLYRWEKKGLFPRRLKLGPGIRGRVGYRSDEVARWAETRERTSGRLATSGRLTSGRTAK